MPNVATQFITNSEDSTKGSSLYYVTGQWVFRCSGNSTGNRKSTTFIRKREIEYVRPNKTTSAYPEVGTFPREGEHDGNRITVILPEDYPKQPTPKLWRSDNGVQWAVAVEEIEAAVKFAIEFKLPRAYREVGTDKFKKD